MAYMSANGKRIASWFISDRFIFGYVTAFPTTHAPPIQYSSMFESYVSSWVVSLPTVCVGIMCRFERRKSNVSFGAVLITGVRRVLLYGINGRFHFTRLQFTNLIANGAPTQNIFMTEADCVHLCAGV